MTGKLKVGDTVMWRGAFGREPPMPAVIEDMQVTDRPREKYGDYVDEVSLRLVRRGRVVFGLTNGHWCYSDQIDLPDTGDDSHA